MKVTAPRLIRWAGLAAMAAGTIFVVIQPIHPLDVPSSVTTVEWAIIQSAKAALCVLGLLGLAWLYARQVGKVGWLGLAGYLLFSLFYALTLPFVFAQAFVVPLLATAAPAFVEGWLGIFNGNPGEVDMGALPALYGLTGGAYLLGGLLFGIATLRAGVLPRWAAGLLAVGTVLPLLGSPLVAHPFDRIFAVPVGLAWPGWATRSGPSGESNRRNPHPARKAPCSARPRPSKAAPGTAAKETDEASCSWWRGRSRRS